MQSNDFLRKIWAPRALISAGRYTRDSALKRAAETGELTAFGRLFISNVRFVLFLDFASFVVLVKRSCSYHDRQPDLPLRLRKNLPLAGWTRAVYAVPEDPHGYTDYPFAEDGDTLKESAL